jgi:CRISPR-associated endonuclease/helicase Cas3
LITELGETTQGLVIVNSRAHALALYRKAVEAKLEGAVHLTTRQYAVHRRRILDEVRARLKDRAPCHLIATSLVEAGVDLDFPRVFRAEAGLEQIAQAAGRCNREGLRPIAESIVGVFRSLEHKTPREIVLLAGDMERIRKDHADDLLSPAAICDYFGENYWRVGEHGLDRLNVLNAFGVSAGKASFEYRRIGESFRLIEDGLVPVIIPIEARPSRFRPPLSVQARRQGHFFFGTIPHSHWASQVMKIRLEQNASMHFEKDIFASLAIRMIRV